MTFTLPEVTDLIRAIAWPLVVVVTVIVARRQIAEVAKALTGRVSRISVFGVDLEIAHVEALDTDASDLFTAIREPIEAGSFRARAGAVPASYVGTLQDLIRQGQRADYAVIDLGDGERWLTTRLYLFAAMLHWALSVERFVFIETTPIGERSHLVGHAATDEICQALASRFPWLALAFAQATSVSRFSPVPPQVTAEGGLVPGEPSDQQALAIIEAFIRQVQSPLIPDQGEDAWIALTSAGAPTYEHARWTSAGDVERVLGGALDTERVTRSLDGSAENLVRQAVAAHGHYIAVLNGEGRFKELLDRTKITDALARRSLQMS